MTIGTMKIGSIGDDLEALSGRLGVLYLALVSLDEEAGIDPSPSDILGMRGIVSDVRSALDKIVESLIPTGGEL